MELHLSKDEADFMTFILDWWLEDFEGATNDVMGDSCFETTEQYLQAVGGMYDQHAMAVQLKEKLGGRASALPTL